MRLEVSAPFDLLATVRLLQRSANNRIDAWSHERYWRALVVEGRPVLCCVENRGTVDAPALNLTVEPRPRVPALREIKRVLRRVLGLDLVSGFEVPGVRDRKLTALSRALRGARPPRFPSLFESFGRIVPYQQVSLEAGSAIVSRFVERLGRRVDAPDGPVWTFPEAAEVAGAPRSAFEGAGLSRKKIESLQRIGQLIATGEITERALEALPTAAALERLDKSIGLLDRALTRRLERLDAGAGTAGWLAEKLRLEAELAAARHGEPVARRYPQNARVHGRTHAAARRRQRRAAGAAPVAASVVCRCSTARSNAAAPVGSSACLDLTER